MTDENSTRHHLLFLSIGIIALILGVTAWLICFAPRPSTTGTVGMTTQKATLLPQLKTLPPFSLTDQAGNRFDNQRLVGRWTFLSFGYTHCPDVCPTTLAMLTNMQQQLAAQTTVPTYQIAFVSIDPERDTPERLAEYVHYFDPDFLGITGSEEELQRLTRPLGILYEKVTEEQSAMGYVMDHSASIILIDPEGRYQALFSPPHDARLMAEDFMAISRS